MGQPAAKEGDSVIGIDMHVVLVPSPPGSPVPTTLPHNFSGTLDKALSTDVKIEGAFAATVDSEATNNPPHTPTPPGTSFQTPPDNKGTVSSGSTSVKVNGKGAARMGDPVATCEGTGSITTGAASVFIG